MSTTGIPIGFVFSPTNEILIKNYLLKKIMGESLPYDGIIERDLYGSDPPWVVLRDDDPWIVSENNKKCIYVFTYLKYVNKSRKRMARTAGCGSWMGKTARKNIVDKVTGNLIGKTEMLVFESNNEKLDNMVGHWTMHEFALAGSSLNLIERRSLDKVYVVCKITKHESKLLKIVPKSVSRKEKDMTKNGSKNCCSNPKIHVAKSDLVIESVATENESNSPELETQNTQEWSSLALPYTEDDGFQIQNSNEIVYSYGNYQDDFLAYSDDMFDTYQLLALLEANDGTRVCAQEDDKLHICKKMRLGDFDGIQSTSTPTFFHMEDLLW